MNNETAIDIQGLFQYLPHRYPFLLLDRVLEYVPGERLVALKNVTFNEPFFTGHFPGRPIMPGVLIIEAMAQAAGILGQLSYGKSQREGALYYLVGVDDARFKRPVVPGDQLILHTSHQRAMRGIWKFSAEARVDGQLAASATLMTTIREAEA